MQKGILVLLVLLWAQGLLASLPYLPSGHCDQYLEKNYYSTCYSSEHRQAYWTYHKLFAASIKGTQSRTDDFRADQLLDFLPVEAWDLRPTQYDRGHMVPAADMKLNHIAMSDTFLMSNISPQIINFNRGIWARLERAFRSLALDFGDAYVVTGTVFFPQTQKTVKNISVANYFYKIIYLPSRMQMFAFLIPHQAMNTYRDVWEFSVKVDEIEELTGIDYFQSLNLQIQKKLEASLTPSPYHL